MSNLLLNGFDAALFLGIYYLNGNLKDKPLALEWLQKACDANNNHSIADHRHLAKYLMDLEVGKQDYKAAYIHKELFKFLWEHYSKEKMSDNAEGSKASIYLTRKNKIMQNTGLRGQEVQWNVWGVCRQEIWGKQCASHSNL